MAIKKEIRWYSTHPTEGPTGPQGALGEQGMTGEQGLVGVTGSQGVLGSEGPRGLVGPAGSMGAKGSLGSKGEIGRRGITGKLGTSTYIHVAWASSSDGSQDFSSSAPNKYIGIATDNLAKPTNNYNLYTWTPWGTGIGGGVGPAGIKGQVGADGADGAEGPKGDEGDRDSDLFTAPYSGIRNAIDNWSGNEAGSFFLGNSDTSTHSQWYQNNRCSFAYISYTNANMHAAFNSFEALAGRTDNSGGNHPYDFPPAVYIKFQQINSGAPPNFGKYKVTSIYEDSGEFSRRGHYSLELVESYGYVGSSQEIYDVTFSFIGGDTGPTGPKGPDGDKGETGQKGGDGTKGEKGDGDKGDKGDGDKGDSGYKGSGGSKGTKGDTGSSSTWSAIYEVQKRNVLGISSVISVPGFTGANIVSGAGWFNNEEAEKWVITNVHNIALNGATSGAALVTAGMIVCSWLDPAGNEILTENAELMKYLPKLDVALLRIGNGAAYNYPVTTLFGDNRMPGLEGTEVMTIGHPYGKFNYKLSHGLIGDARCDDASWMTEAVTTDYETFGGNSGGPVFNSAGEVIAMHTWAYEVQEGSCSQGDAWDEESCAGQGGTWSLTGDRTEQFAGGIGAFPMQVLINAWRADIVNNPTAIGSTLGNWSGDWGAIGIQYENMNTSILMNLINNHGMAPNFGLRGCYVTKVYPGGPAALGNIPINEGDIILELDGAPVGPSHAPAVANLASEIGFKGHTASVILTIVPKAGSYGGVTSSTILTGKMVNISQWIRTSWI